MCFTLGLSKLLCLVYGEVDLDKLPPELFQALVAEMILGSCLHVELRRASGIISDIISLEAQVEDMKAEMAN